MKVKYCEDTGTLYIEFRADAIVETRDLDENTLLELDAARVRDDDGACEPAH